MYHRQRNTILLYLQDDDVRRVLVDATREQGWEPVEAATLDQALHAFSEQCENLGIVVIDDMTGTNQGNRHGMLGIDFLQQRSTHMFALNIPFVLLTFKENTAIRDWADSMGGWVAAMPARMSALLALFIKLELQHTPPVMPLKPNVLREL